MYYKTQINMKTNLTNFMVLIKDIFPAMIWTRLNSFVSGHLSTLHFKDLEDSLGSTGNIQLKMNVYFWQIVKSIFLIILMWQAV